MKWLTAIFMLVSFGMQAQKEPVPEPSQNYFQQAKYMAYIRELDSAFIYFQKASLEYNQEEQWDSLAIVYLSMSRMKTLRSELPEAIDIFGSAEGAMSKLSDTSAWIQCYYSFVKTGHALASYNIGLADSLGHQTLLLMDRLLPQYHLLKINMLNDHGIVQYYQHEYLKADSLVNLSLECANELYEPLDMRKVPSLNLSATIKDAMGYSRKATEQYQTLIEILDKYDRDSTYDYALMLNNLAGAIFDEEGALASIRMYEKSLQLTKNFEDRTYNIASIYYNMANMLNSIGYRHKALNYINACLEYFSNDSVAKVPFMHYIYILKANILSLLGRTEGIEESFKQAAAFIEEVYPDDQTVFIEFLRRRASSYIQQEKYHQALTMLDSCLLLFNDPSVDIYSNERPELYTLAGEAAYLSKKYHLALDYFAKSIDDFLHGSDRHQIQSAFTYASMAKIHLDLNDVDEARIHINQAIKVLLKDSSEYKITNTYHIDDYYLLQHFNYVISTKINVLLNLYEKYADEQFLKSALIETYTLEEILKNQDSEYLEDSDAIGRTNEYYQYYETILKTRISAAENLQRPELLELSLLTAEATRDLMIKHSMSSSSKKILALPDSLLNLEQELLVNIKNKKEELNEALLEKRDATRLRQQLDRYTIALDRIKNIFKNDYPEYYQKKYGDRIVHIENLQEILSRSNSSIINYFLGDEVVYAILLTENSIHPIELGHPDTINQLIAQAIKDIRQLGSLESLEKCYDLLFAPLVEFIPTEHITIIPDGKLHFLPFEALISDDLYLIEKWHINYAHSFYSWAHTDNLSGNFDIFCLAPGFDDSIKVKLNQTYPEMEINGLIRQPNALNLAQLTREEYGAYALSGSEALESRFKYYNGGSNILILATHAEVEDAFPLYSRIALLPDSMEDGYLHAYEVQNMELPYDLAILTACQTGLGKLDRGQGAASLSQAFRYAGCDQVMMSLWSIDEKQSTQLVARFLDHLTQNENLTSSLTASKREYLNDSPKELKHPFYWSGLVLVGGPHGPGGTSSNMSLVLWLLALSLMVIIIASRKKRNQS